MQQKSIPQTKWKLRSCLVGIFVKRVFASPGIWPRSFLNCLTLVLCISLVLIGFTVRNLLNYCVMLWSAKALLHFTPKGGYISAVFMKFASQFKYTKDSGAKNTIKSYYLIGLKRLSTNISFPQNKKVSFHAVNTELSPFSPFSFICRKNVTA